MDLSRSYSNRIFELWRLTVCQTSLNIYFEWAENSNSKWKILFSHLVIHVWLQKQKKHISTDVTYTERRPKMEMCCVEWKVALVSSFSFRFFFLFFFNRKLKQLSTVDVVTHVLVGEKRSEITHRVAHTASVNGKMKHRRAHKQKDVVML